MAAPISQSLELCENRQLANEFGIDTEIGDELPNSSPGRQKRSKSTPHLMKFIHQQ
jgi:hypothetical protein